MTFLPLIAARPIGSLRVLKLSADRRLDGIARDLGDPAMADRTIGAIAFDWGFSDLSHFTRRFKQRFGCRPRDWRAGSL